MDDWDTTRPSLLVRIRDGADREAWRRFVEIYAPLIHQYARRRGLQDADADDLTQDVLRAVSAAIRHLDYEPDRGSFRGWLFTITRNKVNTFLNQRRRQTHWQGSGDTAIQDRLREQPSHEDEADRWRQDYEQRLFHWAAERVRAGFEDRSWQAFWRSTVEGQSPKAVAEALGMSVGAVYIARSRVIARLKEQLRQLSDDSSVAMLDREP